jgi:hypothetical protein
MLVSMTSSAADEKTPLLPSQEQRQNWEPSIPASSPEGGNRMATAFRDPRAHASLLSRLTFSYLSPLFRKTDKPLRQKDLFSAPEELSAEYNAGHIEAAWDTEVAAHPDKPSLARALYRSGACRSFIRAAPLKLAYDLAILTTPVVFGALIKWFSTPSIPPSYGFMLAAALLVLSLATDALLLPSYFYECSLTGLRADRSLGLLLHRKALRLATTGRNSTGEVVSLLSVDAKSLDADMWM